MEQNNKLNKDQVNKITADLLVDFKVSINELVEAEKIKLEVECNNFIEEQIKPYEELHKLYPKIEKLIKEYNDKTDKVDSTWDSKFSFGYLQPLEEIKENIKLRFYDSKQLTTWSIDRFENILETKIKSILCTVDNAAYENIVKILRDKLNLNDLFDNRQKYLN